MGKGNFCVIGIEASAPTAVDSCVRPKAGPFYKKGDAQQTSSKFFNILGPTGFDSETSWNVSMSSAGVQLVNIILHTFNWRK
jgi:hypothetical protein